MTTDLAKTYDPKSVEPQANRVWTEEKLFHAEPTDPGQPYAIVIPPPNVTAALHLGHALNNTLQDILIRWRRMAGDNAVWMPGTDHAGIATQTVVEKRVLAEEGRRRTDFPRDEFVAKIQAWKDEYEKRITEQLKAMGCSCDWERQAFTMDQPRARAVREAFFQLFKDGLIYRGKRLVNWDPATQTALADDEVEMEEIDGHFYYLKYPVVEGDEEARRHEGTKARREHEKTDSFSPSDERKGDVPLSLSQRNGDDQNGDVPLFLSETTDSSSPSCLRASVPSCLPEFVTVATTRPETMLGDTAVAINPKDPRAAALRGKHVRLPIVNRIVPIIEDEYVVLPDPKSDDPKAQFATGFLKVTPAHDPNDYDIGQRHSLPMINILAPDGSISDQHGWPKEDFEQGDAGFLLGLDRFEARKAVVEWFKKNNLLEEVKPYRHSVGHSYRSHVPIEPYLSDQWYCKVTDPRLAGAALRAMSPEPRDAAPPSTGIPGEGRGGGSRSGHHAAESDQPRKGPLPNPPPAYRGREQDWEGKLCFYPARYAKTFQTWHENICDWCISRQLWWGHRIPVWDSIIQDDAGGRPEDVASDGTCSAAMQRTIESHRRFFAACGVEQDVWIQPASNSVRSWLYLCARSERAESAIRFINEVYPGQTTSRSNEFGGAAVDAATEVASLLEAQYKQDPDVLDTWFSSGLWPMSTFGWPDLTPALQKWNPTHTLVTAREIVTLWVSRMVMFNLYFLDRLPFSEVFVHAMIQDGEGRKMSKSLGNGVDPLDIIDSHGADAMRFTLTLMTTQTQDVRMPVERDPRTGKNTSPKFDIGRNFCNKIWNAVRFALISLAPAGPPPQPSPGVPGEGERGSSTSSSRVTGGGERASSTPSLGTPGEGRGGGSLADRWIISRFNRTVQACDEALRDYRFDQYAKSCYDFFWGDLCDWYLEAIKPAMKDPARAPQTAEVLAAVIDGSLRLLHPIIPFITETIWWKLNEVRPNRGVPGRLECPPSERLIKAAWPKVGEFSEAAEAMFPKLQETIGAIRNLRNEYKIDPKKTVTVTIIAQSEPARQITENQELVELLATCKLNEVGPRAQAPEKAAKSSAAGVEIYVEGLIDEAAEQQRAQKRREELSKQIAAMKGRLANPGYIAKAPPHLVKQTQEQLAAAEAELGKLE